MIEVRIHNTKNGYRYIYASCTFWSTDVVTRNKYVDYYKNLGYTDIEIKQF